MEFTLTQKWLRQNIQPYSSRERVYSDTDVALSRYPSLRPKSDVYTYDDGRTQLLLCLHGLIPISYRGASYNIPVAIWITREYPAHPPIVYVVPTSDMLVKAGKYIDVSGRCSIEYTQNWTRKSEGCSLSGLVETLQDYFSREPPVYAKPKQATTPPGGNIEYVQKQPPPLPTSPRPEQQPSARPLLPPKPGYASRFTSQSPSPSRSSTLLSSPFGKSTIFESRPPPSLPASHPRADLEVPRRSPADRSSSASIPSPIPSISPPQSQFPFHDPRSSGPPSRPPPPVIAPPPPNFSITLPPHALTQPLQPPGVNVPPPVPNLLDEESVDISPSGPVHRPSSFAPPPRPPNPELLRLHDQVHQTLTSELASLAQALSLDAERLRAQQSDLLLGEPAIRDEMARLEAVRDVCHNVSSRMRSTVDQTERNISELRRKGDPEVDELVCSTTIVHNQLINLVAEDNAIEDTIYHLHRALNSGRIDLERFLRTTRILAEEQFMKRALIEKIQPGVPMSMSMGSPWS
ncbi:UEV-domain-containing protein [Guyanagaster necrorhizus]|uniref:UEV-domain-containing protein n=1 Tax=Guyanagaster necrorhizus TaxID=856835 RepID=A0A9P7W366_9AGAR|nr:UEV-domain-containing protein [Guyanagaster necrorhizus MCA 3950]KAG7452551.1 UEV-domain-containing protein [Guyanagaster necrorhizus MCA 3950]